MMYQATLEIAKAFEQHNLKCRKEELDRFSYVEAGYSGTNVKSLRVRFISSDNDNDVSVRVLQYISVPEEKRAKLLSVLNQLNGKYRYVKFVMDKDGDVNAEYDVPQKESNVGEVCVEIFARFIKILDDSYPTLMQALWA